MTTSPLQHSVPGGTLRADQHGRYCLRQLHQASGGQACYAPELFLFAQPPLANHAELEEEGGLALARAHAANALSEQTAILVGRELAYAYAGWVGPIFYLQVLRAAKAAAQRVTPEQLAQPRAPLDTASMFDAFFRVARMMGCDPREATVSASQAMIAAAAPATHDFAQNAPPETRGDESGLCFTPTELGHRRCVSAKTFNQALAAAGLQDSVGGAWVPTSRGAVHAVLLATGKARSSGAPIRQLKWRDSVLCEVAL